MNVDDEHEYEQFYDFSKTYEGHPDAEEGKEKTPLLTKKSTAAGAGKDEEEGDGWEDVDVEDAASAEEAESSSSDVEVIDDAKKEDTKTESSFSIITDSQGKSGATS